MGPREFYREGMSRAAQLLPKHGLDLLVVLIAVVSAGASMLRDDPRHPSGGPLFVVCLACITSAVLALLFRRAFRPSELSGGQQQRVAPCRPFAHRHVRRP